MKLYHGDASPFAARIRLAIYRKGLPVELALRPRGEPGMSEFRALNPIGKIPALQLSDGTLLPESVTILEYLEDKFPDPPLAPPGAEARARMRLIGRLSDLYVFPALSRLSELTKLKQREPHVVAEVLTDVRKALGYVEYYLADGPFALGAAYTLADCALAPLLSYVEPLGKAVGAEDLLGEGKLQAYWACLRADATTARVLEEMRVGAQRRQAGG
ncbi:MAG: glutathione S-transferase family protein [Betaproteobacteria bacterium]|nr:glutathione S-transferase family protein [Betaproteobacteria bacterium]